MSEELDHRPNDRLDERLRGALRDLDRRAGVHLESHEDYRTMTAPTAPGSEPKLLVGKPGSRHRLVPAMAGFAVIALLITVGWLARPEQPTPPAFHPTPPVTTPTPSPTSDPRASQSEADAARDGVIPILAWLSVSKRVKPIDPLYDGISTRIATPEGIWLISRPDIIGLTNSDISCLNRKVSPTNPYQVCNGYSEILLMTPDLTRILRAYPIPFLPAQWLYLTADGVYCGRQGDGALPDSMACRIDRKTMTLTARVFPSDAVEVDAQTTIGDFNGWPGTWKLDQPTDLTGFDQAKLENGTLQILDIEGKPTIKLNPKTLEPLNAG